ncbi:MAG: putative LPS assembly protein LptD [Longimicrobiales bacterium]
MTRAALLAALLFLGLGLASAPAPLAGQDRPAAAQGGPGADQQADSTRQQILERLRRLGRAPGSDSVLYVQDSVRLAQAAEGVRPGAGAGLDSVAAALSAIPGYSLTEYRGASADFRAEERVLVLRADSVVRARVVQEGMQVEADSSITFDQATGLVRMEGPSTFTPPQGDPVESNTMVYDLDQARGSALDAQTSYMQQGSRWLVRGDMPFAAQDSSFMSHARFTSCDLEVPHSHFETDEIKIVGGRVLVARGVRLHFADVPVFWLPFVAQSLSSGRASGLLTPRFSVNDIVRTSGGYRRRVSNLGFYWAMSDYSDALFAMDWFSQTFFSVTGSTQYRFNSQFLEGNANARRYWREDGGTELSFDTRHTWRPDERTNLLLSGRYASSNAFVRENSFNPREVTQSIDSEGGINRRFGWGSLSLAANRQQYLSDDRTEWTLPSANLSLVPVTLFRAPPTDAHFWNNMTWSGSSSARRSTVDRLRPDTFVVAQASTVRSAGSVSSNLSLGRLTLSQNVDFSQDETLRVPEAYLLLGSGADPADLLRTSPARDIAQANLGWSASVNYQQQLIGSTTITPRLTVSGNMFRSDTSSVASDFVSAPSRVSFGAQLKTDIYGFYPGFGGFEAVRHKLSPSFDYQWSPESSPSALQAQVFGSRALRPQNAAAVTLNQTWEAKRRSDAPTAEADSTGLAVNATPLAPPSGAPAGATPAGPRRVQQAQIVNLLALRTSVVRYDFVQADSTGNFLQGFETTRLANQISSDILRGLSVSTDHELFEDTKNTGGAVIDRRFAPHLAQVNLSFSLGSSSAFFRWIGLSGDATDEGPAPEAEGPIGLPGIQGSTDESRVIPTAGGASRTVTGSDRGSAGGWNASFSYSLQRPRDGTRPASQMLTGSLQLQPTDAWTLAWQTAYDIEAGSFNDHSIRLTRDLHEWQANFDFLQTATGNWSFRFEVSLLANRDLKFDYDQQNLDLGLPSQAR